MVAEPSTLENATYQLLLSSARVRRRLPRPVFGSFVLAAVGLVVLFALRMNDEDWGRKQPSGGQVVMPREVGEFAEAAKEDAGELLEWQVVAKHPVQVHEAKDATPKVIDVLQPCTVLLGRDEGAWVALPRGLGYIALAGQTDDTVLRRRSVTYQSVQEGTCSDAGQFPILHPGACQAAGVALGLGHQIASLTSAVPRPEGCYAVGDFGLWFSLNRTNKGNGADGKREPICCNEVDPCSSNISPQMPTDGRRTVRDIPILAPKVLTSSTALSSTTRTTMTTTTVTTTAAMTLSAAVNTLGTSERITEAMLSTSTSLQATSTAGLNPPSTTTPTAVATSANLPTVEAPTLFCFVVFRPDTYEKGLLLAQEEHGAGIFACNAFKLFSNGPAIDVGSTSAVEIPLPAVGNGDPSVPGTTTNSWLNTAIFQEAWEMLRQDGEYASNDWTVKVDPDTVFFPERLRPRLLVDALKSEGAYICNCNRSFGGAADVHKYKLFGSIEVFSRAAVQAYMDLGQSCKELEWHNWGEDFYLQSCMDLLNMSAVNDFEMLGDARCFGTPCTDPTKVAFHDFKDVDGFFACWESSLGPAGVEAYKARVSTTLDTGGQVLPQPVLPQPVG